MNRMNKFLFFVPLRAAGEFLPPFSTEVCCFEMRHERVGQMLLRITRFGFSRNCQESSSNQEQTTYQQVDTRKGMCEHLAFLFFYPLLSRVNMQLSE